MFPTHISPPTSRLLHPASYLAFPQVNMGKIRLLKFTPRPYIFAHLRKWQVDPLCGGLNL